ncbi:MAG: glycosyltransferase family 4 protein [Prevotella sp.]|nr:glycosyltransferase family 4 protein [Prevotella sp.]
MATQPLKIVYITPSIHTADGAARVLTMKANYFAEHFGYDITFLLTEGKGLPFFYHVSDKIKIINYDLNFEQLWNCPFWKKFFIYIPKQIRYKRLVKKDLMRIRPDITMSLLRREINFLNNIKDGSRKMGEIHVHRDNYRNFKGEKSNFVMNLFAKFWSKQLLDNLKKLDRFVVLTDKDRESWIELDNVVTIPNPSPFMPTAVSPLTEKRVIAVARYSHEKGIDLLLEAWAQVEKRTEEWRLEIFGDGDTTAFNALIDKLGIDRNRCQLHGRTNDVEQEYLKSSIAVCSSRYEGFGMVIIEAMACGLAVASFDCPWGPRSIIKDGEDGLLVKNGDVGKLADALVTLIQDSAKREAIAKNAIQSVKRFQMDKIAEQWKLLFESVIRS